MPPRAAPPAAACGSPPGPLSCSTRPPPSDTARVAKSSDSFRACVLMITVAPVSRSRASVAPNHTSPCRSSPAAGSSSSSNRGPCSSARAIESRCRMPRENVRTMLPAREAARTPPGPRSHASRHHRARTAPRRISDSPPRSARRRAACCATTIPISAFASSDVLSDVNRTLPLVGRISSAAIRSSVVLPAPFGPSSATNSPGENLRATRFATPAAGRIASRFSRRKFRGSAPFGIAEAGVALVADKGSGQPRTRSRSVFCTRSRSRA